eukprot:7987389-Pyramimonas_sp.AAC.1
MSAPGLTRVKTRRSFEPKLVFWQQEASSLSGYTILTIECLPRVLGCGQRGRSGRHSVKTSNLRMPAVP